MGRRSFLDTTFRRGVREGDGEDEGEVPPSEAELEARLLALDRALAGIGELPDAWLVARRPNQLDEPGGAARLRADGAWLRAALRSVLASSSVGELPAASRRDPRVVSRLRSLSGEADFALLRTVEALRGLDEGGRAQLGELLGEPARLTGLVDELDQLAESVEVPAPRRRHLRRMFEHLGWRLERQSISELVDELLATVTGAIDKLGERMPGFALQPALAGGPVLMVDDGRGSGSGRADHERAIARRPLEPGEPDWDLAELDDDLEEDEPDAGEPPRRSLVRRGGRLAGVGVGLGLLGAGALGMQIFAGVYALTAAALLLLIGGVMALVGVFRGE